VTLLADLQAIGQALPGSHQVAAKDVPAILSGLVAYAEDPKVRDLVGEEDVHKAVHDHVTEAADRENEQYRRDHPEAASPAQSAQDARIASLERQLAELKGSPQSSGDPRVSSESTGAEADATASDAPTYAELLQEHQANLVREGHAQRATVETVPDEAPPSDTGAFGQ
jgi:hypothetical protein